MIKSTKRPSRRSSGVIALLGPQGLFRRRVIVRAMTEVRFGTKPIHDFLNFNVPVFTTQGTQFIGPFRGNLVKGSIALEYHFPTNIVAKSLDKRYKGPCEFPQFVARKELGQPRERPHLEANPPSIFRVQLVESCQQSIRYHVFPLLQGFGDKVNVVNARLRCILQNKKVKARLATGRIVSSE